MTQPPAAEVYYLARVGAFAYLPAIAEALRRRGATTPHIPTDVGLTPRRHDEPNLGAQKVYAKAERDALAGIAKADQYELDYIAHRLRLGITEGLQCRASLLTRGHPVPGRNCWLVPE